MLKYARESKNDKFIVATEAGILHEMIKQVPNKHLIPAPAEEDNSCACSECFYMRMNTLKKLFLCLEHELPAIEVEEKLAAAALIPIEKMLALSK